MLTNVVLNSYLVIQTSIKSYFLNLRKNSLHFLNFFQNQYLTFHPHSIKSNINILNNLKEYFENKPFTLGKQKKHIIYLKVNDINDAFKQLLEKEKLHAPLFDKELRFVLSKVQIEYNDKYENDSILLSRLSFKNCSTALIQSFITKNCVSLNKLPRAMELINCAINDSELTDVLTHINTIRNSDLKVHEYPVVNMKLLVEGCRHLTYSYLEIFNHKVEKWNQIQEYYQSSHQDTYKNAINKIGLNVAIRNSFTFKREDFLKLSTFESIRGLKGLKLKKIEGDKMDQVMNYMLSSRLIFAREEQLQQSEYLCSIKGISFDSSVCNSFDDLCLYEEYFNGLQKLRFKSTSATKQTITFSQMRAYSLDSLKVLKIKNCVITTEFFQNLSQMKCIKNIQLISLKGNQFDPSDLNTFLSTSNLQSLGSIDLGNTCVDDDICYTLFKVFSNRNTLEEIDISNNQTKKLTHKGIKYLTYITSLQSLNISNCSHAVNDSLSTFIVDLLRRKTNKQKERYINKIDSYINKINHYQQTVLGKCDKQISEARESIQEVEKVLQEIERLQQIHKLKINSLDNEDFFNPDDTNLYLNIKSNQYKEYLNDITDAISQMVLRDSQNVENNQPIFQKLKELEEKKLNFIPYCQIQCMDLSGNKNITSIFFEDFIKTKFIERLFYLNLSKTSVCGEIFNYIQNFDSQKVVRGQSVYRDNSFIKQGTLEIEEGAQPLEKITEEKILSQSLKDDEEQNEKKEINVENKKEQKQDEQNGNKEKNDENKEKNDESQNKNNNLARKSQQQIQGSMKDVIANIGDQKKNIGEQNQSINNMSLEFKTANGFLEVLILSSCKNIKPSKFEILFSTIFYNLHELNLHDCIYFDSQFERFIKNKSKCFSKLKTINLQYANITNESIWKFLYEDQILLEIYLDYTNFSQNPSLTGQINPIAQSNQQKQKVKLADTKNKDNNRTQEEKPLLQNVFLFSVIGCKIWTDNHLLEILEQIKSPIFDFNYFISCYRYLITKKLVYYIVKDYQQMKRYFYLNLSGAQLPDIEESEKYQEEVLRFYQWAFKNFQKNTETKQVFNSPLESFVVDNSRMSYKLFTKILKYHPSVKYVSCNNTPYLMPVSVEHKKVTFIRIQIQQQKFQYINLKNKTSGKIKSYKNNQLIV